ncbi:hypothetical protein B7R21_07645 [Subtercola boreus]|uniref:DUF2207 domain-containing protein n=1 Tax=Subtercola boreus TaxID=120213 RepID=A0A3E0VWW0_9MICO|nr:DUF2207 domain-containing protein [Subtercola boreus]RFA13813.1 hypothetical protein B7R21_07645 [Subtercola boreus]
MTGDTRDDDGSTPSSPRGDAASGDNDDDNGAGAPPENRIPENWSEPTPLWRFLARRVLGLEAWLRSLGGRRLRVGLVGFWAAVGVAGGVLLFGPVINPPLSLDDITSSASTATDRWIARKFDVDYRVERASDGRLQARVQETIDAVFPEGVDENGIQRVLPTQYQGHSLGPADITAMMDDAPIGIGRSESTDQLTLTLDSGGRLDGDHTFVIGYSLHDLAFVSTDQATGGASDLLAWDVFGPSWPQVFAGLDVSVTMPSELASELVRQPRGSVAWTFVGAGSWLDPEPGSPQGEVTYRFTNEQNIPPHAQARFTMVFQPGTFTMPPPTPLFLLQTFGPLLPLAFLTITLLLALAARRVAWSDARGRPWFVAQYEVPDGVTPRMAAQVLRAPRALELASALDAVRSGGAGSSRTTDARAEAGWGFTARRRRRKAGRDQSVASRAARTDRLRAVARSAERAGRVGDRLRAQLGYLRAAERRGQFSAGLRRVPTGFVRDLFIASPIALTVLQWGIIRQLSHQTTLAVVWWPAAFVLASSLISIVVLVIALSARPLTRKGALVKQQLRGIQVYSERTNLLERTTTADALLPYAVLLDDARDAGRRVGAIIQTELGDPDAAAGWRTLDFLSGPRVLTRVVAVLSVAAAIGVAATLPNPYPRSPDYVSYAGDLPGTYWTKVTAFDAAARMSRTDDGRARLDVVQKLTVTFDDTQTSEVPQFAQQFPVRELGQDLGLRVTGVRLDGADAPFATSTPSSAGDTAGDTSDDTSDDTLLLVTRFGQVLSGSHRLEVDYSLDAPVVAATGASNSAAAGQTVDRMRWAALLEGWDDSAQWGEDAGADPLRVTLTVPASLAGRAVAAGWISVDTSTSDSPRGWEDSVVPFGGVGEVAGAGSASASASSSGVTSTDSQSDADGATTYRLDLRQNGNGYPFELTVDDVGAMLDFPAGTFTGPSAFALRLEQVRIALPMIVVAGLAALALALGVASVFGARRRHSRRAPPGLFRDVIWWLGSATALAAVILFVWATSDMPDDWPEFTPLGISAVAAILGVVLSLVFTLRVPSSQATAKR